MRIHMPRFRMPHGNMVHLPHLPHLRPLRHLPRQRRESWELIAAILVLTLLLAATIAALFMAPSTMMPPPGVPNLFGFT
jgi:hypothetical protein